MRSAFSLVVLFSLLSFVVPESQAQQNVPANMVRARQSLQAAKDQLLNAGGQWGGHRMAAISYIEQALQEIQKAEAFASKAIPAGPTTSSIQSVLQSPNPELVSQLTKALPISPSQASGGAGSLFALAKSRLSAAEFTLVAAAVPGMDALLKAAPESSALSSLQSYLPASLSGLAPVAGSFQKLGLSPQMAGKFVPVLINYVQSRGGFSTGALLAKVLQ